MAKEELDFYAMSLITETSEIKRVIELIDLMKEDINITIGRDKINICSSDPSDLITQENIKKFIGPKLIELLNRKLSDIDMKLKDIKRRK